MKNIRKIVAVVFVALFAATALIAGVGMVSFPRNVSATSASYTMDDFNAFSNAVLGIQARNDVTPLMRENITPLGANSQRSIFESRRLIVRAVGDISTRGAIAHASGFNNIHILQFETEQQARDAFDFYSRQTNVLSVTPDTAMAVGSRHANSMESGFIRHSQNRIAPQISRTNGSPDFLTWGAPYIGVESFQEHLNSLPSRRDVVVAVIDTGLDFSHTFENGIKTSTVHPFFENRVAPGGRNFFVHPDESSEYYEDWQDYIRWLEDEMGEEWVYEYVNNPYFMFDLDGHGTHVAGTIIDLTLDNVKVLPIAVPLGGSGETFLSSITMGLEYVAMLNRERGNIVAVNMSLGVGANYFPDDLREIGFDAITREVSMAVESAYNAGVLSVAASGNQGINDVYFVTPANQPKAITVSAIGRDDDPWASWGSKGAAMFTSWGSGVNIAAPGVDILSAIPMNSWMVREYVDGNWDDRDGTPPVKIGDGWFIEMSGTSMAAPHVAASVALVMSDPTRNITQVKDVLYFNARDMGNIGNDYFYGNGLLCLEHAWATMIQTPINFSRAQEEFTADFNLTLSNQTPGIEIYFTTDGTVPRVGEDGTTRFITPITINQTTIVRAIGYVRDGDGRVTARIADFGMIYFQVIGGVKQDIADAWVVGNIYGGWISGEYQVTWNEVMTDGVNNYVIRLFVFGDMKLLEIHENMWFYEEGNWYAQSQFEVPMSAAWVAEHSQFMTPNHPSNDMGQWVVFNGDVVDATGNNVVIWGTDEFWIETSRIYTPGYQVILGEGLVRYRGVLRELIIPERINNIDIELIELGAFMQSTVTSVTLPATVTQISMGAFAGATRLQHIFAPEVTHIDSHAFMSNISLASITDANFPKLEYIGRAAFIANFNLMYVNLSNVTEIGDAAFYWTSLELVVLPSIQRIYGADTWDRSTAFGHRWDLLDSYITLVVGRDLQFIERRQLGQDGGNIRMERIYIGDATVVRSWIRGEEWDEVEVTTPQQSYRIFFVGGEWLVEGWQPIESDMLALIQPFVTSSGEWVIVEIDEEIEIIYVDWDRVFISGDYLLRPIQLDDDKDEVWISAIPDNTIIKGFTGSFAEEFANENGHIFRPIDLEFVQPVQNISTQVINGILSVTGDVQGFGLTFQWFSNTTESNVGGTQIAGATSSALPIPLDVTWQYVYVVVTDWMGDSITSSVQQIDISTYTFHTATITAGAGGTITPGGTLNNIVDGSEMLFTVTPNAGFEIYNVTITFAGLAPLILSGQQLIDHIVAEGGIAVTATGSFTISAIFQEEVVTIQHTITIITTGNGTANPTGTITINQGGSQTIAFAPNAGFRVQLVTINGAETTFTNNTITLTNVTANMTVRIYFAEVGGNGIDWQMWALIGGGVLLLTMIIVAVMVPVLRNRK